MNEEDLIEFYDRHKDYEITLNFYECESRISLEDFINLVKLFGEL